MDRGPRVSRDDVRNALHAHFTQATKQQQLRAPTLVGGGGGGALNVGGRRRIYSFIQVQKKKLSLTSKRLFGGGGGSVSKSYILCVTVQDGNTQVQLHYLQLLSTFAVEVRQSWDIGKLQGIENNGLATDKKRGAFSLFFQDEDTPWQWLVDDGETSWAIEEFVWSLCALAIDQKKAVIPRLVRFNLEELNEVAIHQNLQKRYGIDIDLLDHLTALKKKVLKSGNNDEDGGDAGSDMSKSTSSQIQQQRLTAAENEDAAALLAGVSWHDVQLQAVEEDLKKKLRVLEDENITFLLSFEDENASNNSKQTATKPATTATSVDRIIVAIEALQKRVDATQAWSNDSSELLETTSQNMLHFESLNNQLEVHFKNSVALQETLAQLMAAIELPRENMSILIKPVAIFPDDVRGGGGTASQAETEATVPPHQRDLADRLQLTIATISRVDQAIKSTQVFPASEMAAVRSRGEELARLAKTLCDKLALAFDAFLQRRVKHWAAVSRLAATAAANSGNNNSPTKSRASAPMAPASSRDTRDASASMSMMRGATAESRASRAITSTFASEFETREMDWAFTNELFHAALLEYQPLFEAVDGLDGRALAAMRQLYAKHAASVYHPHVHTLFRSLRDKLPKAASSKTHFAKPQALQSWSVHLSSSSLSDEMGGAAPLFQQALDHLVPIVLREQHFLTMLFFPGDDRQENDQLTPLMEAVFDRLLKRMADFGDAAAARNILDALALVVLVNPLLSQYQLQSAFLFNVLVSFQVQMKKALVKFAEDQESWIQSHQFTDTRMAGVLSPVSKTLTMVARLEESVGGRSDDATLASLYHRMLPATMQWLDKIAETKPKYTAMVRLENYLFIHEKLVAINATATLPLGQYASQAWQKYTDNLLRYVAYVWSYEFKQLAPLLEGILELAKTVPHQEIAFHTPRQDVRRVLEATTLGFEKAVKSMHDRMKKHFSVNAKMLPVVWGRLVEYARERLTLYEKICADCYQLRLEPTPLRAVEMLNKFASSAPPVPSSAASTKRSTNSSTEF